MKKEIRPIRRPLNEQAQAITDAETELRIIVLREYAKGTSQAVIDYLAFEIIRRCIHELKLNVLKDATYRSLANFYNRQMAIVREIPPKNMQVLVAVSALKKEDSWAEMPKAKANAIIRRTQDTVYSPNERTYGQALNEFADTYSKKVKPILTRLAKDEALDPDDLSGRNTLRNRAEMEVRYAAHADEITGLKSKGVKLVIASTHSDCSDRCAKWQGRVYSLDGTSGTAPDGRQYIPLETATDVYYTTKRGKVYKNGLLGFNCRHYLVEYQDGLKFTRQSEKIEKQEYAITLKQREMERRIRDLKVKAITNKGLNAKAYNQAVKAYKTAELEYIKYSHENNRAYYRSRIKII